MCALLFAGESPLWLVPVSISTASSPTAAVHRFVLRERETTVTLENIAETDWVKVRTEPFVPYFPVECRSMVSCSVRRATVQFHTHYRSETTN